MDKLKKYRDQWWNQGNFHPMAEWEKVKLPYILAENVTIDKYEERTDRFNVRGCWEWDAKFEKNGVVLGEVAVYELPLQAHEVCAGEISSLIFEQCLPANRTDAKIYILAATRTRVRGFGKEADGSFRPEKSSVDLPNGSDGLNAPWPNLVVEVASSESTRHVKEKARNYWLYNNRVRDVIIVKLYDAAENQIPSRMKFDTHDANGDPLSYQEGTHVIRIPLDCLYHDVKPPIEIPRSVLPDPIILDFFFVRKAILKSFSYKCE
ncbi:19715_t:CDS:2 [Racocetra fulgida]|uniref:19715_t:CDS:1 n=1 Tax=Racocetra fulgida TaxID=60492 RepID=A0A9N9AHC8_9GLOM|nr:19715_t:CDS:2 [Racocetra fulgida]